MRKNVDQNVVVDGIKRQWAAVKAARKMALEKPLCIVLAPGLGFEPRTNGLHIFLLFPEGMDYIIILRERRSEALRPMTWPTPRRDSL